METEDRNNIPGKFMWTKKKKTFREPKCSDLGSLVSDLFTFLWEMPVNLRQKSGGTLLMISPY